MAGHVAEPVAIATPAALVEASAAGPRGGLTFTATSIGRPVTEESFGNWFRETCAAGVKKSANELHTAAATADAMAGRSDVELDT